MNSGRLIVFEGIDGCGKTTQLLLARDYLRSKDIPVIVSREPGGTKIGESVRHVLLDAENKAMCWQTELLLYIASRAQHAAEIVLPALARGEWVLLDRYADSSVAYQGYGRGLPLEWITRLNEFAMQSRYPDLVFILEVPLEVAFRRRNSTGEKADRIERETREFYERVAAGYRFLADQGGRYQAIRSNQPREAVAAEIQHRLDELLFNAQE